MGRTTANTYDMSRNLTPTFAISSRSISILALLLIFAGCTDPEIPGAFSDSSSGSASSTVADLEGLHSDTPQPESTSLDSRPAGSVEEIRAVDIGTTANAPLVDVGTSENQSLPTPVGDYSLAIVEFLKKFDVLSARGFVPTLRSGSTGIGYTLETMLNIEENNSPGGDFMGMELKAFRDDDLHMDDSEKMNLFLKEPAWIDGLKHADRVKRYGYVDDNGRQAMYSTVQIKRNSHGFVFRIDREAQRVYMQFKDEDVAFWTFQILEKRLVEKHSEAVFVAAHARGKSRDEEFHYYAVTWCRTPSVAAFVDLIQSADVMLELRMHIKPTGSVRNHGSAFRIKQNKIPKLYAKVDQVRPVQP